MLKSDEPWQMMVGYCKLNQMVPSIIKAVAGVVYLDKPINTASSTSSMILIWQMYATYTQFLSGKKIKSSLHSLEKINFMFTQSCERFSMNPPRDG